MSEAIPRKLTVPFYLGLTLICLSVVLEFSLVWEHGLARLLLNALHILIQVMILGIAVLAFRPALIELHRAHTTVREREHYLSQILNSAAEGFAAADAKERKVTQVNPAFCSMIGYQPNEILGKSPLEFVAPENLEHFKSQLAAVADSLNRHYQVVMRHKDGHNVYTQYSATTIFDKDGHAVESFAFITDITDMVTAQMALEDAKIQAEKATQLKDNFISLIAHDLHNPIGAVRGYAEFMMLDMQHNLHDDQKHALQHIHDQCNLLLDLISDVLDLSRLQSGKIALKKEFLDAHYITENIIHRLHMQAAAKGVTLINDVPVQTRIHADYVLIGQVLQNLISNAIKFSYPNSEIRAYLNDREHPTIAIEDHGIGMAPKVMDHLFTIEENHSRPGTEGEVGTGFGMPLSRQIMQSHEGDIEVTSTEGEGSTLYITLPAVVPRVLIVDDDPDIRSFVRSIIEASGATPYEAENGIEALKFTKEHQLPDLIITDLRMPVMDGLELIRSLRFMYPKDTCPIIVLTAEEEAEHRDQCLAAGANDFTQKPIEMKDFLPRIRHFIA